MKTLKISILILFATIVLISSKNRPIHIFMAGDSTMALKPLAKTVWDSISGDSISEPFPERGWGQVLPDFFNENVIIKNYAQNGRSSRTFIEQGWWQKIIDGVRTGDFVIIQFGHNDEAIDRPDRYTPPEQYIENLSRFVDDVKAKGGKPIICTSVVRRRFGKSGNFLDSHGVYVDLARKVAKDKRVYMIDMYEKSKKYIIEIGEEESTTLFLHLKTDENKNFPGGKIDNTHFRDKGARVMASLFIEGVNENNINSLTKNLKE